MEYDMNLCTMKNISLPPISCLPKCKPKLPPFLPQYTQVIPYLHIYYNKNFYKAQKKDIYKTRNSIVPVRYVIEFIMES